MTEQNRDRTGLRTEEATESDFVPIFCQLLQIPSLFAMFERLQWVDDGAKWQRETECWIAFVAEQNRDRT